MTTRAAGGLRTALDLDARYRGPLETVKRSKPVLSTKARDYGKVWEQFLGMQPQRHR